MFLFLTEVWSESEDIFLADMSREACLNLLLQRRTWTFGRLLASGWQRCDNLYDIRVTFESDASKSLCSCSISVQPSLVYYSFETHSLSLSFFLSLLSCQQHEFNFGGVGLTKKKSDACAYQNRHSCANIIISILEIRVWAAKSTTVSDIWQSIIMNNHENNMYNKSIQTLL